MGFTLVELLVVTGIIGVLVAIILPAIGNARWHARVVICASNLRSLTAACNSYAASNSRQYPSGTDISWGSAGNLWDVSTGFYNQLRKHGAAHESFFCPGLEDLSAAEGRFHSPEPQFNIIGYNVWIPRANGGEYTPPSTTSSRFQLMSPMLNPPLAGPSRLSDVVSLLNPIITDVACTVTASTSADDLNAPGDPYEISPFSCHTRGQRLVVMNAAYADGHVDGLSGSSVHPRFKASAWHWR